MLYKARSTSSFEYLGDDPTRYEAAFAQETGEHHQDLKPLIDLLKWVFHASDAEFAAGLDRRVDVASLARYLALQELLDNFDDMGGPGQNYYLWHDSGSGRFTVLTWDLNLALAGFGGGPGGWRPDDPKFTEIRACIERVRGADGAPEGRPGGRGPMGDNPLKDRFLAAPGFAELYAREYAAVYDALYGSGHAVDELDRLRGIVAGSGLVEAATVEREASALRETLAAQAAG